MLKNSITVTAAAVVGFTTTVHAEDRIGDYAIAIALEAASTPYAEAAARSIPYDTEWSKEDHEYFLENVAAVLDTWDLKNAQKVVAQHCEDVSDDMLDWLALFWRTPYNSILDGLPFKGYLEEILYRAELKANNNGEGMGLTCDVDALKSALKAYAVCRDGEDDNLDCSFDKV